MESNFNHREFEHYVKSNADQYRMIPSEKVWRGINSTLHTRRRWYGIGLGLLLLLTATSVTWVMLRYPNGKKQESALNTEIPINSKVTNDLNAKESDHSSAKSRSILPFDKYPGEQNAANDPLLINDAGTFNIEVVTTEPVQSGEALIIPGSHQTTEKIANTSVEKVNTDVPPVNDFDETDGIDNIDTHSFTLPSDKSTPNKNASVYSPLTIESVTNSFKAEKLIKKLRWQMYFTPTVSYRKLGVNKSYSGDASPFSASNYPFASPGDVNSEVVHKPDMGLELGLSAAYPLLHNLKLLAGVQFNINRYDIKAFAYYGEQATINLNGGNGSNSLTAWTFYRNHDGYKSDWLKNYYFSVSAPIGAEIKVLGNKKTYLGVAGTVQPTYILKDRAFMISTDYKNYVEVPHLIRHVNVNASLETFVSYTSRTSKTRWQIGPQIRYQVLSSFKNPYPVTENLFDFGLKVGVMRNK